MGGLQRVGRLTMHCNVCTFVRGLAWNNNGLVFAVTDGFVDLCAKCLDRG
jgi:hypothetical protein